MEKRNFKTNPVKVFLAVGHGGPDPGAVKGDIREAACNLTVALTVRQELERHGMQVLLSRYTDVENRLPVQIAQCNQFGPELAMAIHTNAGGGSGFTPGFDLNPEMFLRLSQMMSQLNAQDDTYTNLLQALRPFMGGEQLQALEQMLSIAKLLRIMRMFAPAEEGAPPPSNPSPGRRE